VSLLLPISNGGDSVSDNFSLKIGIEGEKEFKKALSDINQSFKVLGSESTGLGLAIAKQIADRHNISLSVTSTVGEGT
jgi:signal transduction histidine kinase